MPEEKFMTKFYLGSKTKAYLGAGLLATSLAMSNTTQAGLLYNITDLGTLGGEPSHVSYGQGINAFGKVTGSSQTPDGGSQHAFVTNGSGAMIDLGTLGGNSSEGRGINASGLVTGNVSKSDGFSHAFVTNGNGQMVDLGTLGGSYSFGNALNDSGQVTGSSDIVNSMGYSRERAFVTNSSGQLVDLGTLGDGYFSRGQDINASGQVTGFSSVNYNGTFGSDTIYHAFVTNSSGTMVDLGSLGGSSSGNAINDSGQVTGSAETDSIYRINHAFVTDSNGQIIDLDPLSEKYSSAGRGINNAGQVVGQYQEKVVVYEYGRYGEIIGQHIEGGETRSFVTINGVMVDLDSLLVASGAGWKLHGTAGIDYAVATSINDAGQITGYGNHNGQTHAFQMSPVPTPAAVWMMGVGLLSLLGFNPRHLAIA